MHRWRSLTSLFVVLAGAALVWACTGPWSETSALEVGDAALKRPLESVWSDDVVAILGPQPKPLPIAEPGQVFETVVRMLDQELARQRHPRRAELVRSAALHLSLLRDESGGLVFKDKQGAWHFRFDLPTELGPDQIPLGAVEILRPVRVVTAEGLPALLRQLPEEFRFYIRSLSLERADAVALCEALLHLPPEQRRNLSALAAYRLARLRMAQTDDLDEDGGEEHLAEVRHDLQQVKRHIAEGAPAIAHLDLAADGWLAHTYLYGTSLESAYDPEDPGVDAARALRMYVQLYRQGDPTARESIEQVLRAVLASGELSPLVQDPLHRKLATAYLCSARQLAQNGLGGEASELNADITAWLNALRTAKVDLGEDAVRLAALQYRLGQWDACAVTLQSAPAGDATAQLLAARLRVRTGDLVGASQLLRPLAARKIKPRPPSSEPEYEFRGPPYFSFHGIDYSYEFIELGVPDYTSKAFLWSEYDTYTYDFTHPDGAVSRARVELAVLELHYGHYAAAMNLFYNEGMWEDGDYIAECVLTTDELKVAVDRSWKNKRGGAKSGSVHDYGMSAPEHVRALLGRRLFRDGRWAEAVPYLTDEHQKSLREFIAWMQVAQDPKRPAKARADAYWKAALNVRASGEDYLFCELGLEWTSADKRHWYDPRGLPVQRIRPIVDEPESLLAAPSDDEVRRVEAWAAKHLAPNGRIYRDASYEAHRLCLEAVKLLPDDDLAGAQILEYAGNLLKYRDPPAAQPAYRELATRFRGTPLGAAARKQHWFSRFAGEPDPDWVLKLSKLR
ncbi:MAG: hypothetical protein EBR62_01715 [Verrucomicrobia bacterium]|nr:hypothetical protein [Verrucomicrobiota bacterium]